MTRRLFLLPAFFAVASASVGAQDRVANAYDAYRAGEYEVAVSVLGDVMRSRPTAQAALLSGPWRSHPSDVKRYPAQSRS